MYPHSLLDPTRFTLPQPLRASLLVPEQAGPRLSAPGPLYLLFLPSGDSSPGCLQGTWVWAQMSSFPGAFPDHTLSISDLTAPPSTSLPPSPQL